MSERRTKLEFMGEVLFERPLTAREAFLEFGDSCLNTTASQLGQKGFTIAKRKITVPTRFGSGKTKVTQYRVISPPKKNDPDE